MTRNDSDDFLEFRIAVLFAVGIATAFWLASFIPVIGYWNNLYSDGAEWRAAYVATPIFLLFVLPALLLGIVGRRRGLTVAGVLLLFAAVIAIVIFAAA